MKELLLTMFDYNTNMRLIYYYLDAKSLVTLIKTCKYYYSKHKQIYMLVYQYIWWLFSTPLVIYNKLLIDKQKMINIIKNNYHLKNKKKLIEKVTSQNYILK